MDKSKIQNVTLDFTQEIAACLEGMSDGDQIFTLSHRGDISLESVCDIVYHWGTDAYYIAWNFADDKTAADICRIIAVARRSEVEVKLKPVGLFPLMKLAE
jgi:hypothetical protein